MLFHRKFMVAVFVGWSVLATQMAEASSFARGEIDMRDFDAAINREARGLRNEVYSKYFDILAQGLTRPDPDGQIHPLMFLRSQRAIVNRAPITREQGPYLLGFRGASTLR